MSDAFEQLVRRVGQQVATCSMRPRYRVSWLLGPPQSGKTILTRRLSEQHGWQRIDYTLTPGFFVERSADIATYQPQQFIQDVRVWAEQCPSVVLLLDELDALLAFWPAAIRQSWAEQTARLTGLPCGIVLVTHLLHTDQLRPVLPDNDLAYCTELVKE